MFQGTRITIHTYIGLLISLFLISLTSLFILNFLDALSFILNCTILHDSPILNYLNVATKYKSILIFTLVNICFI